MNFTLGKYLSNQKKGQRNTSQHRKQAMKYLSTGKEVNKIPLNLEPNHLPTKTNPTMTNPKANIIVFNQTKPKLLLLLFIKQEL